jgi:hypothetical protein
VGPATVDELPEAVMGEPGVSEGVTAVPVPTTPVDSSLPERGRPVFEKGNGGYGCGRYGDGEEMPVVLIKVAVVALTSEIGILLEFMAVEIDTLALAVELEPGAVTGLSGVEDGIDQLYGNGGKPPYEGGVYPEGAYPDGADPDAAVPVGSVMTCVICTLEVLAVTGEPSVDEVEKFPVRGRPVKDGM